MTWVKNLIQFVESWSSGSEGLFAALWIPTVVSVVASAIVVSSAVVVTSAVVVSSEVAVSVVVAVAFRALFELSGLLDFGAESVV